MSFPSLRSKQTQLSFSARYSRQKTSNAVLPSNTNDLNTLFNNSEYTDVSDIDGTTVDQTGDGTNIHCLFLFKERFDDNTATPEISWTGQSTVAPSSFGVLLSIFNYKTGSWEPMAENTTSAADTDFYLTTPEDYVYSDIEDYYDPQTRYVAFSVIQEVSTGTLKTDDVEIAFFPSVGGQALTGYDIIRQIPASTSDADEKNDTTLATTNVSLRGGEVSDASRYDIGLRWQNITISAGSPVTAAVLNLYITVRPNSNQSFVIKGILEANPAVWTSSTRPSQRTKTTATVNQTIGTGNNGYLTSNNVTAIVQEIIDQGGWASGNSIAFVIEEDNTTDYFRMRSSDSSNLSTRPEIGINYTAGTTTSTSTSTSTSTTSTSSSTSTSTTSTSSSTSTTSTSSSTSTTSTSSSTSTSTSTTSTSSSTSTSTSTTSTSTTS